MYTYHGEEATPVIVKEREDKLSPQLQGPFHEVRHPQEELVNRQTAREWVINPVKPLGAVP